MACSCTKKTFKAVQKSTESKQIKLQQNISPFDQCNLCAFKHISYALIKMKQDIQRFIGQIFLSYKHLDVDYPEQAMKVFAIISKFFEGKIDKKEIEEVAQEIHNLSEKTSQNKQLNLEDTLTAEQRAYLYFITANELYNFEYGYKDINYKYVLGLLLDALENTSEYKEQIRNFYKAIQGSNIFNTSIYRVIIQGLRKLALKLNK